MSTWRRATMIGSVVVVAAAALIVQTGTSSAADSGVCDKYCDGRDPALAPAARIPVKTSLYGRELAVHVDDSDSMAWVSVSAGASGDRVWLDRSFDGGRTWDGGSRLGEVAVAGGAATARSPMFNVDDWAHRGVGALRACGAVSGHPDIACTAWTRSTWNAGSRRTAAATALMMRYRLGTGLFDNDSWWTSANALTALIDDIRVTGMASYSYAVANTYDKQVASGQGQFRNEYLDDTGWWGLAWVAAYDLTGDGRYLATARADADHMYAYWDSTCGGGIWWSTDRTTKVAIANSLYIQLNAELSKRLAGDTVYRNRATAGWTWFRGTGMLTSANLVVDRINLSTCRATSGPLTYNSGVLMNALVQLNKVTGDASLLGVARQIADASTTVSALNRNGVLREPGEGDSCAGDQPSWKGEYVRGLGVLSAATGGAYGGYLRRQADSAYSTDRDSLDAYGIHWAGPPVATAHACQQAALDLLNAAP